MKYVYFVHYNSSCGCTGMCEIVRACAIESHGDLKVISRYITDTDKHVKGKVIISNFILLRTEDE